jgi:hypothetical protein
MATDRAWIALKISSAFMSVLLISVESTSADGAVLQNGHGHESDVHTLIPANFTGENHNNIGKQRHNLTRQSQRK